jgi:DENN (AEX-3) domain
MTKANGEQVHVCCITVWHPVPQGIANELEKQCEEWRKGNLSQEEREIAQALSSKLAIERAMLSTLLQQLPSLVGADRDDIDEQILQCEEKIALYNELLKPVRLHAAAKVEGLTEGQGMWIPRCYGLLGRDGSYQTVWREWLRAITVPWVAGEVNLDLINSQGDRFLPLERYVVNICGEVPLPTQGKTQVELAVRELKFQSQKTRLT